MKFPVVLLLWYFSAVVWAGGYQGGLERVWLFQAYEIDGLNPASERQLGFRCKNWDYPTHSCKDGIYEECRGTRPEKRCTFDELMFHLGKAPQRKGWSVIDPVTKRLDVRETALNCYNIFAKIGQPVSNFPPYKAMKRQGGKDVYEFNDYIEKLSYMVDRIYPKKKNDDNKHLWEDFDRTREMIQVARAGDHGQYLLEAAKKDMPGIEVQKQNLGTDPLTGKEWETIDWAKTSDKAKSDGVDRVDERIRNFRQGFYYGVKSSAREHLQVIKSYKRTQDRITTCRM